MSRTQDTILIDGVPTRPLQETVPQSKSAAGLAGPAAGGTKTPGNLFEPPPSWHARRQAFERRRAGGYLSRPFGFKVRPLVVPPIWSRSICP